MGNYLVLQIHFDAWASSMHMGSESVPPEAVCRILTGSNGSWAGGRGIPSEYIISEGRYPNFMLCVIKHTFVYVLLSVVYVNAA